jgi:serine/threonine protein phosphatase PrpC
MVAQPEEAPFEFGFASDAGRKRGGEPNQDALKVVLPEAGEHWHPPLLLVADGLGKYAGGSLASQLVVKLFKQEFKQSQHPTDYLPLMEKCVQAAHQEIRAQGAQNPKLSLMGSTVVAVVLTAQRLYLLNIGDSRAYVMRGRNTLQISQDQSWVAAQMRAGVLTKQEAQTHPDRSRLTMAITAKRTEVTSYTAEERLEADDSVLLCSDGLWGVVPETLIHAATMELSPQVAADKLVALANQSKGPDNISVIIARRVGVTRKMTAIDPDETNA